MSAPRGSAPKGSPPRATLPGDVVAETFGKSAAAIAQKAVEQAEAGDVAAMRLVFDRVAPAPRERAVRFDMPPIESVGDLPAAVIALMQATARGELVPGEAAQLAGVLEQYRKQSETADLAERIKALEDASARKS